MSALLDTSVLRFMFALFCPRTCLILTDVFQLQHFAFIILQTFGFGVALQIMAGWI